MRHQWQCVLLYCLLAALLVDGSFTVDDDFAALLQQEANVKDFNMNFEALGDIDEMFWGSECLATEMFGRVHRPTLIKGSFVNQIPALKKWNADYIAKSHPGTCMATQVEGLIRKVPYFTKKNKFPTGKAIEQKVRTTFRRLMTPSKDPFSAKYFSMSLADFEAPMRNDFEAQSCLFNRVSQEVEDPSSNVSHVWISTGKPTTAMHYDAQFNVFLQIIGRKTFILVPPSELRRLYLFPWLSDLSRQCGVDNLELIVPKSVNFAAFQNVSALRVSLGPGEMLYLPPFWSHRVESESDFVVSLNAWSDVSEVYQFDLELPKVVLPFDMDWTDEKKSVALQFWFVILHEALLENHRPDFFSLMLKERYLMVDGGNSGCETVCGTPDLMSDAERDKFRRYSAPIVEILARMAPNSPYQIDIRELFLANYMEKTADYIFAGNDCRLIRFFQFCV